MDSFADANVNLLRSPPRSLNLLPIEHVSDIMERRQRNSRQSLIKRLLTVFGVAISMSQCIYLLVNMYLFNILCGHFGPYKLKLINQSSWHKPRLPDWPFTAWKKAYPWKWWLAYRTFVKCITLQDWQARWNRNVTNAQWIKRLIPNLEHWLNCKYRRVDYHLTLVLSGDGVFRAYAFRFTKDTADICIYCSKEDTAAHTIFEFHRWAYARDLAWENMVHIMMSSKRNWRTIQSKASNEPNS